MHCRIFSLIETKNNWMSFDRHTSLHRFPGLLPEMYQRDLAGGARQSTSDRKYFLVTSGDVVTSQAQHPAAISATSVTTSWQLQPSTIVSVRVVRHKFPTTDCSSVRRTSNPEAVNDVRYRAEVAPRVQPMAQNQKSDLVGCGTYIHGQSTSVTPHYQSVVGQPVLTVQRSSDISSSALQQMMANRRSMQEDVYSRVSNRESIPLLQQLTNELQQQQLRTGTIHCYAGSSNQSVIRPVPVKAQPGSMPRFHRLMSSSSHVPSTTVVSSVAQNSSQQAASYRTMQSESDYFRAMVSPNLSQRSPQNTPMSPSRNTDPYHRHPVSASQSVTVSQSMQFAGSDRSPTGRQYPASGASLEGSFISPTQSVSSLASAVREQPNLPWHTTRCSPVHSHPSQSYSSHQHSVVSPQNYHRAQCLPSTKTQMPSRELQSAKQAFLRHTSPKQHAAAIGLAAKFASSVYSSQQCFVTQCSPESHYTQPQNFVSDSQMINVSSPSQTSSDLHHRLGSPVPSRGGQHPKSVKSLQQHPVSAASKPLSPTKVTCLSNKN